MIDFSSSHAFYVRVSDPEYSGHLCGSPSSFADVHKVKAEMALRAVLLLATLAHVAIGRQVLIDVKAPWPRITSSGSSPIS
jgi:hypothetical protein